MATEIVGKQIVKTVFLAKGNPRQALLHLPDDFYSNPDKKYPLLIFHSGSGETSNGANGKKLGIAALLIYGPPKFIADGNKFQFNDPVTGELTKFIVLSPQQNSTGYPLTPAALTYMWQNDDIIAGRVDEGAVFVTGLSLGGIAATYYFADQYADQWLDKVTALVPMSAQILHGNTYGCAKINQLKTPVWMFSGKDETAARKNFVSLIQKNYPDVKVTIYPGGHNNWNNLYDPKYKENGVNIYEWMLSTRKRPQPAVPVISIDSLTYSGITDLKITDVKISGPAELKDGPVIIQFKDKKIPATYKVAA